MQWPPHKSPPGPVFAGEKNSTPCSPWHCPCNFLPALGLWESLIPFFQRLWLWESLIPSFKGSLRGCFLLSTTRGPNPGIHRSWPVLLRTERTSLINNNIKNFSTSVEQRKAQGSNFSLCIQSPLWQPLQWVFWQVISLRESLTFCSCPRQSLIKFWMLLLRHPLLMHLPYFAKRRSLWIEIFWLCAIQGHA